MTDIDNNHCQGKTLSTHHSVRRACTKRENILNFNSLGRTAIVDANTDCSMYGVRSTWCIVWRREKRLLARKKSPRPSCHCANAENIAYRHWACPPRLHNPLQPFLPSKQTREPQPPVGAVRPATCLLWSLTARALTRGHLGQVYSHPHGSNADERPG